MCSAGSLFRRPPSSPKKSSINQIVRLGLVARATRVAHVHTPVTVATLCNSKLIYACLWSWTGWQVADIKEAGGCKDIDCFEVTSLAPRSSSLASVAMVVLVAQ